MSAINNEIKAHVLLRETFVLACFLGVGVVVVGAMTAIVVFVVIVPKVQRYQNGSRMNYYEIIVHCQLKVKTVACDVTPPYYDRL